jgi:hypothetical protein
VRQKAVERSERSNRIIWILAAWAAFLIWRYYAQLWRFLAETPGDWTRDANSLSFVRSVPGLVAQGPAGWIPSHLTEAIARAALGAFGAILVLTAAWALGSILFRLFRWSPENPWERFLFSVGIGLGSLSYLSLGLAALGWYRPPVLRVLVFGVAAVGIVWGWWERSIELPRAPRPKGVNRLWAGLAVAGAGLALVSALAPEVEYDAAWYHLGIPSVWLEQGTIVDFPNEFVSLYPMTSEITYGIALSLGGAVAAKLLHFSALLLIAGLVYRMARRWTPSASPWLAVALLVTVPTVLWEASTAYIDLGLTFLIGLGVYAAWSHVRERQTGWLILAVLSFGLAAATKHLALLAVVIVALGMGIAIWNRTHDMLSSVGVAALVGVGPLLIALPWYWRAWAASGNPFFPELFSVFGAPAERWDAISERGLDSFLNGFGPATPLGFVTLPWDVTVHGARYGGSLGPLFLLLLPMLLLFRRKGREVGWIASFVLFFVLLWASPLSSFQMRFLMPIVPFLAVLGAEAFARVEETVAGRVPGVLHYGVALLLALNLAPFTSFHETDRVEWDGWLTHVIHQVPVGVTLGYETQNQYLTRKIPSYAAWQYINSATSPNARVLTFSEGDHMYSKRERVWINATAARPAVWDARRGQDDEMLRGLASLGVTYVLMDVTLAAGEEMSDLALTDPRVADGFFQREYEDPKFVVYSIRWPGAEASTPGGDG